MPTKRRGRPPVKAKKERHITVWLTREQHATVVRAAAMDLDEPGPWARRTLVQTAVARIENAKKGR
jgi:hypothetical protein